MPKPEIVVAANTNNNGPDTADAEAAEELLMLFGTGSNLSPPNSSPPTNGTLEETNNKKKRKISSSSVKPDVSQGGSNPTSKSSRQPATRSRSEKWTQEEDAKLRALVEKSMANSQGKASITDRWTKIARLIGNKTSTQCFQHWHRVLNPDINKEPWTPEEEELLLSFVKNTNNMTTNGKISWSALAMNLKGRTDTQCRYQYIKLERSRKVPWTSEEDRHLLDLYTKKQQQQAVNWVTISQDLYVLLQRSNETRNKTPPRTSLDCKLRVEELTGIKPAVCTGTVLENNKSTDGESGCETPPSSYPSETSASGSPVERMQFNFRAKITPNVWSEDDGELLSKEEEVTPQRKKVRKTTGPSPASSNAPGLCPVCHKRVDQLATPRITCSECDDQFHMTCLNIQRKPRGNWSCDECRKGTAANDEREDKDHNLDEGASDDDGSELSVSDDDADKLVSFTHDVRSSTNSQQNCHQQEC
jgi:hypothetical protein